MSMLGGSRPTGRLSALAIGVVLVGTLAACGDDKGVGSDGDVERLSEKQATSALLSDDNLGDDFRVAKDDDDDGDDDLGCISATDELPDAPTEVEVNYEKDDDLELPAVGSSVSSYDSEAEAKDAFEEVRDALEGCTNVDVTDSDDARTQLAVSVDGEKSSNKSDEQLNITATGTISSDGITFDLGLWLSASRVDNHVTIVSIADLEVPSALSLDPYVITSVERLMSVVEGDEPSDDLVDAGSSDAEGDDDGDDEGSASAPAVAQLPLDGGSYTWPSGITLKLSVEKIEPWGSTDDFCGDGSCGVANPKDTRFVLKYEVTVPDSATEPFDPSSCPGELHVKSGNDDEALSGVAGDFYKSLDGKIFPGESKFGVAEYLIEKAYAAEEFYIESTCGDLEYDGDSAYFVGPIKKTA